MLKKLYFELVLIRKELQAIWSSMESQNLKNSSNKEICDGISRGIKAGFGSAIHDTGVKAL